MEHRVDSEFWERAWATGRTGFHQAAVHHALVRHAPRLLRTDSEVVFVPLCGRSVDMIWLESRGHTVVGCELVADAVAGFFSEHERTVEPEARGALTVWRSGRLTVLQGDVFAVPDHPDRPAATAVWDRAALVALPPARRGAYVRDVLRAVCVPGARILLSVFDYDSAEMTGPPFSVPEADVRALFSDCDLELLSREDARELLSRPDRPLSRCAVDTWLITVPA